MCRRRESLKKRNRSKRAKAREEAMSKNAVPFWTMAVTLHSITLIQRCEELFLRENRTENCDENDLVFNMLFRNTGSLWITYSTHFELRLPLVRATKIELLARTQKEMIFWTKSMVLHLSSVCRREQERISPLQFGKIQDNQKVSHRYQNELHVCAGYPLQNFRLINASLDTIVPNFNDTIIIVECREEEPEEVAADEFQNMHEFQEMEEPLGNNRSDFKLESQIVNFEEFEHIKADDNLNEELEANREIDEAESSDSKVTSIFSLKSMLSSEQLLPVLFDELSSNDSTYRYNIYVKDLDDFEFEEECVTTSTERVNGKLDMELLNYLFRKDLDEFEEALTINSELEESSKVSGDSERLPTISGIEPEQVASKFEVKGTELEESNRSTPVTQVIEAPKVAVKEGYSQSRTRAILPKAIPFKKVLKTKVAKKRAFFDILPSDPIFSEDCDIEVGKTGHQEFSDQRLVSKKHHRKILPPSNQNVLHNPKRPVNTTTLLSLKAAGHLMNVSSQLGLLLSATIPVSQEKIVKKKEQARVLLMDTTTMLTKACKMIESVEVGEPSGIIVGNSASLLIEGAGRKLILSNICINGILAAVEAFNAQPIVTTLPSVTSVQFANKKSDDDYYSGRKSTSSHARVPLMRAPLLNAIQSTALSEHDHTQYPSTDSGEFSLEEVMISYNDPNYDPFAERIIPVPDTIAPLLFPSNEYDSMYLKPVRRQTSVAPTLKIEDIVFLTPSASPMIVKASITRSISDCTKSRTSSSKSHFKGKGPRSTSVTFEK